MKDSAPPKGKRIELKDIPDEDFIVLAMTFGAEMKRRIEKMEKEHERGEMQEKNKPFEEFNGKE